MREKFKPNVGQDQNKQKKDQLSSLNIACQEKHYLHNVLHALINCAKLELDCVRSDFIKRSNNYCLM